MAGKHKTIKCNNLGLFIPEFDWVLTKIMYVKINVTDGFKKGRNHSMQGVCRENLGFLFKGVKAIHPQKAWKGLFLMSMVMNN